jgi:hypothetical protein
MRFYRPVVVAALLVLLSQNLALGQRKRKTVPDPAKGYKWEEEAKKRGLDPQLLQTLKKSKIVIGNHAFKQVFTPYIASDLPIFVTSDSLLNAFHVLYEESILRLERANARKLPEILRFIWKNLATVDRQIKGKPELAAASKARGQIVIGTALQLLGEKPPKAEAKVAALIKEEAARITKANARLKPKWLGPPDAGFMALDYSRYKPRGFYTKSPDLVRYFRAVSWLQSIPFRVGKDEELLTMLMLGNTISRKHFKKKADDNDKSLTFFDGYREFIGAGDDWDIVYAADQTPNELRLNLQKDDLANLRNILMEKTRTSHGSLKINDQIRFLSDDLSRITEVHFRILSAYRIPDALLFQRTTDPRIFSRPFPSGLEVCAALGSSFAKAKLTAKDKDKLLATIAKNKQLFTGSRRLFTGSSLYCQYLHCLAALLDKPEPDAPPFMASEPWQIKSCQTVLGGWAQLRHTWALQAKQSVLYLSESRMPAGFVEPVPEFYYGLTELAKSTEELLKSQGAFAADMVSMAQDLRSFIQLLEKKGAAKKGFKVLRNLSPEEKTVADRGLLIFLRGWLAKIPADKEESPAFARQMIKGMTREAGQMEKGEFQSSGAYGRLLADANMDLSNLWKRLIDLCRRLEVLAHKQLRRVPFNDRENRFLKQYGEELAGIMLYGGNSYKQPRDDAPRIVDVFTNPNAGRSLHVGIGRARALYVLYPVKGGEVLCRGAVLPYYEFPHAGPLDDRSWKALLDSDKPPDLPDWVKPIFLQEGRR